MGKSVDESVSVVIPNFNYGRFLGDCLRSVLAQSHLPSEIIVVDNFSEDDSEKVARSFESPLIRFIRFQNMGSIGAARNHGWELATGKHIAFLDSDDTWFPEKLSRQMTIHTNTKRAISYHDFELTGLKFPRRARGRPLGQDAKFDLLAGGNAILTSGVVISRNLLEETGGFPEDKKYFGAEDFGLWLKVAEITKHFHYIPRVMGTYRVHESISNGLESWRPATEVTNAYRSELSSSQTARLDGWLAYARSASGRFSSDSDSDSDADLVSAIKKGSFRFKWRAVLRLTKLRFDKYWNRNLS